MYLLSENLSLSRAPNYSFAGNMWTTLGRKTKITNVCIDILHMTDHSLHQHVLAVCSWSWRRWLCLHTHGSYALRGSGRCSCPGVQQGAEYCLPLCLFLPRGSHARNRRPTASLMHMQLVYKRPLSYDSPLRDIYCFIKIIAIAYIHAETCT